MPSPLDCLGGTLGYIPTMLSSEQDITYFNNRVAYFDRQDANMADGDVHFIGDSLVDGMDVAPACPYALNRGIGGDTFRGVLNRINHGSSANSIHRAGAAVLMIGVNDLCSESSANGVANVNYMWDQLAPGMTGKWVVCHVIHVSSGNIGARNGLSGAAINAAISSVNNHIDTTFSGSTSVVVVNVNPTLAPSGTLLSSFTIDGVHLSKAGCDVWRAAVSSALMSMGI